MYLMVFTANWPFLFHYIARESYVSFFLCKDAVLYLKCLNAFQLYHVTLSWLEDEGSHLAPSYTPVELQ